MSKFSVFTIKCPVCGKGDIPFPFDDDGCGYCRHCGASMEQIREHWDIQCKMGGFAVRVIAAVVVLSYLFSLF